MSKKKIQNKKQVKSFVIAWTNNAWEDYLWWQQEDPLTSKAINDLLDDCRSSPFKGLGKPEPLKGDLTGYWSRRITREHRLVYLPEDGAIYVAACRYHY